METIKGPAAQGSDSEVAHVLREARVRIEKGWTQGAMARNANGRKVPSDAIAAVRWCSDGAIFVVVGNHWSDKYSAAGRVLDRAIGTEDGEYVEWNDAPGRTQAEVLAAFDRAIALAEGTAPKAPSVIPASPTSTDEGDGNA